MLLGGLQKTTLIDYPEKIACTVFTVGCNFRCPFCHNKDLVSFELFKKSGVQPIEEKDFFEFLEKRKKILEGVTITGGEPCINPDLPEFIRKIKKMGYLVKLDTNGSKTETLKQLIDRKLLNYIAMDVKSDFDSYFKTIKLKAQSSKSSTLRLRPEGLKTTAQNAKLLEKIKKSIRIILKSGIDYEFRTTVVPGIHNKENLVRLAKQLRTLNTKYKILNTDFNYVLQQFRPKNCLDPKFLKVKPYSEKQMKEILSAIKKILPGAKLRGLTFSGK